MNLWDETEVSSLINNKGENLMHYVLKSGKKGNLLSFLMPDWFDSKCREKNYYLINKSRQFEEETGKKFLDELYKLIDDDDEKLYQDVFLRILFQYLSELDNQLQGSNFTCEFLSIENVLKMRNKEYKEQIMQVMIIYCNSFDSDFKTKFMSCAESEQIKDFIALVFLLRQKHFSQFQKSFEDFLKLFKKIYGDYYEVQLRPQIFLLFLMTKRQNLHNIGEFILQKFSLRDTNKTMADFYDNQDLILYNFLPFKNEKLNELVI